MNFQFKWKRYFFCLVGSSVLLNTATFPVKSWITIVPGKSLGGIAASTERINEILIKYPTIKEQVENELQSFYDCSDPKVLKKEEGEEWKPCTNLYRSLVNEKIWFEDKILWEVVNFVSFNRIDPKGRETCYDAELLGTGKGIKCVKPKIKDPKTGRNKDFITSCSIEYLNRKENKITREELLRSKLTNDLKEVWNDQGIPCVTPAKEGSKIYRKSQCRTFLMRGKEDEQIGIILGKFCREKYPELINEVWFGEDTNETRKKIQRRIAGELIRFDREETRKHGQDNSFYRDLMSNKYSKKQKRFNCMEAAVNNFSDAPNFYKKYCNNLMK